MFDRSTVVNREFVTFRGQIVFIKRRVLIVGVAKFAIPFIRHEIWEGVNVSCNRGEPIVEHNVELCRDVAQGRVEYKRDSACVIRRESHLDATHAV
jgi:hypothetical protein